MTLCEGFHYALNVLNESNIEEAEFKALCMACETDGIRNNQYVFHKNDDIDKDTLLSMLDKIKNGQVLQYVIGKWDFCNYEYCIGEGVLIPRPETEEVTELAVETARQMNAGTIFDLCSGSGCIGLTIAQEVEGSSVFCIEKSREAFFYLEKNAKKIKNATPVMGDILNAENLDLPKKCDIIVSNPPYIKTSEINLLSDDVKKEPHMALDGGKDGLLFYRSIAKNWLDKLNKGGALILEIGNDQGQDVKKIFSAYPLKNIEIKADIYGNERIFKAVHC